MLFLIHVLDNTKTTPELLQGNTVQDEHLFPHFLENFLSKIHRYLILP